MAGRFSVEAVFKAIDRVTAPVTRMQNRVGKFTRSMGRGLDRVNRKVKAFGQGLKKASLVATGALFVLGRAIASIVVGGAEFGRAIGSAAIKFPEDIKRGTKAFKDLEAKAREVGATTEFTATQAANGLKFLAKAGFTAAFSMAALKDIVDFATSSEIEFAEAADIASDALGAFNLNVDDPKQKLINLKRVMDVMSSTANRANLDVTEMFESIKKAAPVAAAAGVSLETFSATLAFLASNGIKASEAGTAAKNVTLALAGVGNQAAATFKRLGISLDDGTGAMRDQLDVLDDLRAKLAPLGSRQRLNIIAAIFGKLPIAAAANLLTDAAAGIRGIRKELEGVSGANARMAAFIRDDVQGSLDSLSSAIDGVKISIFSLNEGALKDIIDRTTDWVRANEKLLATKIGGFLASLLESLPALVENIGKIAKGIAAFIIFTAVLRTFILVMTAVNIVMALNPIGLIVLAVVAAIAALVSIIFWWDEFKGIVLDIIDLLAKFGGPLFGPLMNAAKLVIAAWDPVMEFFSNLWQQITDIGAAIKGAIFNPKEFFNFDFDGGDRDGGSSASPTIVSPQDRTARQIEERRETSTATVTIKDESGRAEITQSTLGKAAGLNLIASGAF